MLLNEVYQTILILSEEMKDKEKQYYYATDTLKSYD